MSKKVKARKLNPANFEVDPDQKNSLSKPPLVHVYSRRRKRPRHSSESLSLIGRGGPTSDICEIGDSVEHRKKDNSEVGRLKKKKKKRNNIGCAELVSLGVDLSALGTFDGPRLRDYRHHSVTDVGRKRAPLEDFPKLLPASRTVKRWVR